jgi:flagellar hook-associated protein 1 FlgK
MVHILNVSQSGLRTAQTAVENVSNNIANENTPGYKKRVIQISEMQQDDTRVTGRGAVAESAYRITNEYVYNNLISQTTKSNYYDEMSQILVNVEASFTETDTSGFSQDLNRYFQAVENLRTNPSSEVYQSELINEGQIIVDSLNGLYTQIEQQEKLLQESLDSDVTDINRILQDIGTVNEQIGDYSTASNDLLDKRDQLEIELAEYVDIEVDRSVGDYSLKIAGVVAIRHNVNVRDVDVKNEETAQLDRFIKSDGSGSNITENFTFDNEDEITFKINNEHSVSVRFGESMSFDIDGDGLTDSVTVDASNYVRALAHKINTNTDTKDLVTAYNGTYRVEEDGSKTDFTSSDKYLLLESNTAGVEGSFEARISIVEQSDHTDSSTITNRDGIYKDEDQSKSAKSDTYITVHEQEISLNSGSIKAKIDNLTTDGANNNFEEYKNQLDAFARTLSDVTDNYVQLDDGSYLFGESATDEYDGDNEIKSIGLFTGTDVKSLSFNEFAVNDLDQDDLNYLAEMQWKKDFSFDNNAQNTNSDVTSSLSDFYQSIRVNVASDKESNDFLLETQEDVVQSIQSNYDQNTKVDKDEEMMNLIKFQAAYTANAKIISAIDEMLQTLLSLKS